MKHFSFAPTTRAEESGLPSIAYLQLAPRPILPVLPYSIPHMCDWVPGWSYALRLNLRPALLCSSTSDKHSCHSAACYRNSGQLTGPPNGLCHLPHGLIQEGIVTVRLPLPSELLNPSADIATLDGLRGILSTCALISVVSKVLLADGADSLAYLPYLDRRSRESSKLAPLTLDCLPVSELSAEVYPWPISG